MTKENHNWFLENILMAIIDKLLVSLWKVNYYKFLVLLHIFISGDSQLLREQGQISYTCKSRMLKSESVPQTNQAISCKLFFDTFNTNVDPFIYKGVNKHCFQV